MFTLGATQDRALKQRTLDWSVKSGQVKLQDTFYPIGSVSGSAEGTQLAWEYFQEVNSFCFLDEFYFLFHSHSCVFSFSSSPQNIIVI